MENLLNPDTGLIIWTIVSFTLLVLLLGKVAWKPLIAALKEREDGIRKAIGDAADSKKSAEDMKAQLEKELASAQDKAAAMIAQTQKEAQKLREQMLKDAETESRKMLDQTRSQLEEEKQKITRDLRQEVAGLSVKVAEKLLKHSMNNKEQENLVGGFIKDIEKEAKN